MTQSSEKILMIACMKDEGPFILEWVAHHLSMGFSRIIVVSNHCKDGTDKILNRLDELGTIRHLPNPAVLFKDFRNYQNIALRYARLQKEYLSADWVMTVDTDEFVNIKVGNGNIGDLLSATGNVDAVSLNTVNFGSNGIKEFIDAPVTEQFTARHDFENDKTFKRPRLFSIKSISKNDNSLFRRVNPHTPLLKKEKIDEVKWVDGSGQQVSHKLMEKMGSVYWTKSGTHELGYVNHYAIKSLEAFLLQVVRGDAQKDEFSRDSSYWRRYDRNDVSDHSIEKYSKMTNQLVSDFKEDKILKNLHDASIEHSRRRAKWLLTRPKIKALVREIQNEAPAGKK